MENTHITTSQIVHRIGRRIRQVARDIDYLERRKLELRTGLPFVEPRRF